MAPFRITPLIVLIIIGCGSRNTEVPQQILNQRIYWMEDSVSWVEVKNGKFGISWEGQQTIESEYDIDDLMGSIIWDGYCYFTDGAHFALGRDGKWGVMDNHGTVIIPFEYEHVKIQIDSESGITRFAAVKKGGKYAIAGPTGEVLTGHDYDAFYGDFHWRVHDRPIITMAKGGRAVFYDLDARTELSHAPEGEFEEATKSLNYNGNYGVINANGEFVVPPQYDVVANGGGPDGAYYMVCQGNQCGIYLVGTGIVLPMKYQNATTEKVGGKLFYIVSREDRYALLDEEGQSLTDFDYDYFLVDDSVGLVAGKGEKRYKIDGEGEETALE
jgi:hypothetical protein